MVAHGKVINGVIVLEEPVKLPEGAEVRVEVLPSSNTRASWKTLLRHAGSVEGLPSDMAENHDHYIHGKPKAGLS